MADEQPAERGDVLELRVHGVSGTPPEDLLARPLVEQIGGDGIAGFYRPRLAEEQADRGPTPFSPSQPHAPQLRSYNWGGLTSGSATKALWLLLLPLTLVNIAPRARPGGAAADSTPVRALWFACRLLALALTCLYVTTGIGVGTDLIAWQCSGGDRCDGASPDFVFHDLSADNRLSVEHMLLLGALVPVAQLLIIGLVARRTANRYEKKIYDFGPDDFRPAGTAPRPAELPLDSPDMWRNAAPVGRLRTLHLQVGFALVLWSVLATTRTAWLGVVPLAVFGYAVVALGRHSFTSHADTPHWRTASTVTWAVLGAAAAVPLVGLSVAHEWVDSRWLTDADRTPIGGLPRYADTVLATSGAAFALLVGVIVLTMWTRRHRDADPTGDHRPIARPPLRGCAAAALAALGTFLAASFSSGVYMYAATWLETGSVKPGYREIARSYDYFDVPAAVAVANLAFTFAIAALLVILLVYAAVVGVGFARAHGGEAYLAADYPDAASDPARARQIRRDLLAGRLVDHAGVVIGAVVVTGGVITTWFAARLVLDGGRAPDHVFGRIDTGWRSAASLGSTGTYLAVFTVIGLVTLGALAFRVPQTRRLVGVLWDVAAFWPRLCHPLAAPCYAERTVPDLVTYISAYRVRHRDTGVVLAAHSQGTVISAAVIRQLATADTRATSQVEVVPRLAYLSFGCVLRRLYGHYFPTYFGPARLYDLERTLGGTDTAPPRWINLWRYTDYLGGQVTDGPPQVVATTPATTDAVVVGRRPTAGPTSWEWHCPDPPSFARKSGETTFTRPGRHSDFWADESGYFQLAAAELAGRVHVPPPGRKLAQS